MSSFGEPSGAIDSLRSAAEALYRSPRAQPALAALGRAEDALNALRRATDDAELARVHDELARARSLLAAHREAEVRASANRLYASAVILLEPHRPWQATHLMLLRVVLRDMVSAAEGGDALAAERLALSARAACRSLGLDESVKRSRRHAAIERRLAEADAARRADRGAALLVAASDALSLVDGLEADLAALGEGRDAPGSHEVSGALWDDSPAHGS
jgi:hypothetical protein